MEGNSLRSLTGAGWYFSASHRDPVRQALHGHSYEVMVYWPADPPWDAMILQDVVQGVCAAHFDHKTLPDEIARAEDIARRFGELIPDAVRVDISRPAERFKVEVWL